MPKEYEEVLKRRLATAANLAVSQRNYRRVRDRALAKLSQKYKEEYLEILAEEKKKDEQEGKRWRDLTGNRVRSNPDTSTNSTNTDRGDTSDLSQDESDNE